MGKRSEFPRFPQDRYSTPDTGVATLLPHLSPATRFIEPCAGEGFLVGHLKRAGHICVGAFDLDGHDARTSRYDVEDVDRFITNPPWRRDALHAIIINLSDQAATWLLIDADWLHTKQAVPFVPRLRTVVSVGRVKWIPDSPFTGKDNACWTLFDRPQPDGVTCFIGRDSADSMRKVAA